MDYMWSCTDAVCYQVRRVQSEDLMSWSFISECKKIIIFCVDLSCKNTFVVHFNLITKNKSCLQLHANVLNKLKYILQTWNFIINFSREDG